MMGTIVILLILVVNKPRDVQVNNIVGQKGDSGIDGKDGVPGRTPIKGVDYFDGKDSISTVIDHYTTERVIKKQIIETPVKGDKGDVGSPIIIYVDYQSCMLMSKYEGDTFGQELAQLPKPCEVEHE